MNETGSGSLRNVAIVGGGAAGIFAAVACAEASRDVRVTVYEKSARFLEKVRISGGGRCNVTHACFDPRGFTERYPRGQKELLSPFHRFQASDSVEWFASRGVELKVEPDGRMFPTTDTSQTIIDCLLNAAKAAGVQLRSSVSITTATAVDKNGFKICLSDGKEAWADCLLLAMGGCRTPALADLATTLGHTIQPPVPSLFTFHIVAPWVRSLAGVSVPFAKTAVPGTALTESGPILFTHWGLSGPAILRLSAWGARALHERNYTFPLAINWLPQKSGESLLRELQAHARTNGSRLVKSFAFGGFPARLWEALLGLAEIPLDSRWATLGREAQKRLISILAHTELAVSGKSLNKDEFVTCGGVSLKEVNFKTMESRICPGLYFAGEILDIDGITGGFNFQAAWTTGWIAGRAMAGP